MPVAGFWSAYTSYGFLRGFRVSDIEIWVSNFGFQVSGSRVSDFEFRVSRSEFRVSGAVCRVSRSGFLVFGVSGVGFLVPGFGFRR